MAKKRKHIKVTYSTLGSPDPLLHEYFDEEVAALKDNLGRRYPSYIDGAWIAGSPDFEARSPINPDWLLGEFAAADAASEEFKPKAISLVLGAGLINAILAGEVVRLLGDALDPVPYAGAYAGVIALNFIGASIVMFLRIPRPPRQSETGQAYSAPGR